MEKMYSKSEKRAINFIKKDGFYPVAGTANCACGESKAIFAQNEMGETNYFIIVCEACYKQADSVERI